MLSWILLMLIVAIVCLIGVMASVYLFGRGEALPPLAETTDVIEHNRRAVEQGDMNAVQLEVVHRGYKMDQVDALLTQLADLRRLTPDSEIRAATAKNGVGSGETPA
ncbi:cell division protein DivIVA [Corynebacterium sanguinis]|uniref:Cell division protein DivIVA n=1 Tax=Corynebacterium sanguinis TaxID=2594913 RepID=A0A6C1TYX8_9CORY|nr:MULTISPECIES: cell division protein DivIVA [Corynebacterium]MBA4503818.1 cell division protein DivIVA [Corynebacterium sanguinis]MCT1413052.1 cell division protein DivIVA [Corynebacterium sanguinis]MCT1413996.1 cell division protein DivIVA [Corynebacterium sanguinis]MCT1444526.1 cell division protein DivIVA [Corynebacterium sanguinis]MCT1464279.1 cell division protein DivIVA [Corynebacterium sanguinis]